MFRRITSVLAFIILFTSTIEPLSAQAGGSTPHVPGPRIHLVRSVLTVGQVAFLCTPPSTARFRLGVQGYFVATSLRGPQGGFVGRLYPKVDRFAFFARDTTPFVQIEWHQAWPYSLTRHWVIFHGVLTCGMNPDPHSLPGWRGHMVVTHWRSRHRYHAAVAWPITLLGWHAQRLGDFESTNDLSSAT